MLHRLANINDQESKVLGLKLINLISSPQKTDHRQHFWFWAYLTVDFLLSDKNSTFCKFFEKEITNSNLIEKIKLFKRITTLNKRAISLSPEKIIEKYRFEHLKATEVWKQLAEDRLIKWFYALWDQQNELEKDFKILREDLETHSLNSKKYISEAGHSNIKHGEFLSAELGYWINTETISKLQKALKPKLAPNIQMILQQAVLQRAAIKNSSLIEYLDYKFNLWFGWNFGKNVLLKKNLLIGSSELRGKVSKS
ncbi:hypothetical protein BY996DRAFT_3511685 [Phakopsora pachyrhizi]|nr:hypothetical protein BY996DRAFT_3511685 [Phakopsora pachyrhizi]